MADLPRDADPGGPVSFRYGAGADPRPQHFPKIRTDGDKVWFDTSVFVNDMTKRVRDAADEQIIRILAHFYYAGFRTGSIAHPDTESFEEILHDFKERQGRV